VWTTTHETPVLAQALDARCNARRLCAPLLPTLRDFILPRLAKSMATLAGAPNAIGWEHRHNCATAPRADLV
jgi:hypothetical protein